MNPVADSLTRVLVGLWCKLHRASKPVVFWTPSLSVSCVSYTIVHLVPSVLPLSSSSPFLISYLANICHSSTSDTPEILPFSYSALVYKTGLVTRGQKEFFPVVLFLIYWPASRHLVVLIQWSQWVTSHTYTHSRPRIC